MSSIKLLRNRASEVGAFYAVTIVTRERRKSFLAGTTVACIVNKLETSAREGRTDNLAWVAMPDHLHWLFQLRDGSLGDCVGRFKSLSARAVRLAGGPSGVVMASRLLRASFAR